jgi:hypothetical protein
VAVVPLFHLVVEDDNHGGGDGQDDGLEHDPCSALGTPIQEARPP